ncbi:helix-turn-helix domain-containing protein [Pseudomonas sp. NPDC087598]|uniref:helix-turn-helix domain-containing protein n=1 Tax=Pseudomonas sp. NPDC087598 TaxID=3364440 RepID=UPI003818D430
MTIEKSPNDLGEFLRARRSELDPTQVGLPADTGRARRVAGLRREEVAMLAGISVDYYTRLEQGRLSPSKSALAAVARSLRLQEDDLDYLYRLARLGRTTVDLHRRQTVGAQTQRLLDSLRDIPVMVIGRYMDVLAWNPMATALYVDFSEIPIEQRNLIRLSFLDPRFRSLYVDWENNGRNCVAFLRMDTARFPDDPRLASLIGELSLRDEDFRRWWATHLVASPTCGSKTFQHPQVGKLSLDWQMLSCTESPDQAIIVMTAAPGSEASESLKKLTVAAQSIRSGFSDISR